MRPAFLFIFRSPNPLKNKIRPRAHPAPTTKRARDKSLEIKIYNICKIFVKKNKRYPTYKEILTHSNLPEAIEDSGHENGYEIPTRTVSNWLTEFRKEYPLGELTK